jgi:hypothetical protein
MTGAASEAGAFDRLYDIFSPVALRERTFSVSGDGPIGDAIRWTFQSVGSTEGPGDIQITIEGPVATVTCESRKNSILTGAWSPKQVSLATLFLACPASRPIDGHTFAAAVIARSRPKQSVMPHGDATGDESRDGRFPEPRRRDLGRQASAFSRQSGEEGQAWPPQSQIASAQPSGLPRNDGPERPSPFALFDTFSPTVLRGKTALIDAADPALAAALAMEIARAGAKVAVTCHVESTIEEAEAAGRYVIAVPPEPKAAVQATLEAYGRLDLLVNAADRGAYLAHAAGPRLRGGSMVNIIPSSPSGNAVRQALSREAQRIGARVNAVVVSPLPLGDAVLRPPKEGQGEGISAQHTAWVVIFLASDAATAISGEVIHLT